MAEGGRITDKCSALLTVREKAENTYIGCNVDGEDLGIAG
jgi:hypothetical protein